MFQSLFSWLDAKEEARRRQLMAANEATDYERMAQGVREEHPVRDNPVNPRPAKTYTENAMALSIGSVHFAANGYRVWVHDLGDRDKDALAPFACYGDTPRQARERAQQLVSALDGARRL